VVKVPTFFAVLGIQWLRQCVLAFFVANSCFILGSGKADEYKAKAFI
jgi:hypothetical protein